MFQWAKIGVNISNFPMSISAIGFHAGLGGKLPVINTIQSILWPTDFRAVTFPTSVLFEFHILGTSISNLKLRYEKDILCVSRE